MPTTTEKNNNETRMLSDKTKQSLSVYLKTGLIVGDFNLIKRIGVGGTGEVGLAEQPAMERDVALKILSPSLTGNENFVSRFLNEVIHNINEVFLGKEPHFESTLKSRDNTASAKKATVVIECKPLPTVKPGSSS